MEKFKFEAAIKEDAQLKKLEECVRKIPNINDWKMNKYFNGVVLSVKAINISAFEIVLILKQQGFLLTRLYEE